MGGRVGDLDGHHVTGADRRGRPGEVDEPVVGGATGEAVRTVVLLALALGDQDLQGAADLLLVLLPGDLLLEGDQPVVALLDDGLGDLVVHLGGGGAGPLGVLEGEGVGEAGLADRVHGLLEVLLGLAREADDDVGRDGRVGHRRADLLDDAEEAFLPVGALHRLEHLVRTGLHRHVQLVHHVRGLGHRGDHVVGEVARVRRGEADALQAVDLAGRAQQLGERLTVAQVGAVGVDVLAEQRDLDDALADQRLDLGEDVAGAAVLLLAAQRGDDAEGAGVVAADRDRDPGGVRRLAAGGQRGGEGLQRLQDLHLGLLLDPGALQQCGQVPDVVGAEDHVDPRRLAHDGVAVLLRQAAADGDLHALVPGLGRRELPEVAVQLVVGVLADGAGVEDHQVGVTLLRGLHVSGVLQQPGEALGVVDVHLTAVRDDLVALGILARTHGPKSTRRVRERGPHPSASPLPGPGLAHSSA